ncbi:MAG TPA: hypothetical protein VFP10_11320 [Candidatus Eisenbacteria bacterium]|nr:hypothetical protein [Candidatus Eisenbacteria bacterium]
MRSRHLLLCVLGLSLVAAAPASQDSVNAPPLVPVPLPPDTSWVFDMVAGSRLYPDWKEEHAVKLNEPFLLGDTPFRAKVTRFLPAFRIENGKPDNWSLEMLNPAVRVFVYSDSGAYDSTWAFKNFPPHFSPKSFFTFQLKEVRGYPPKNAAKASPKKEK